MWHERNAQRPDARSVHGRPKRHVAVADQRRSRRRRRNDARLEHLLRFAHPALYPCLPAAHAQPEQLAGHLQRKCNVHDSGYEPGGLPERHVRRRPALPGQLRSVRERTASGYLYYGRLERRDEHDHLADVQHPHGRDVLHGGSDGQRGRHRAARAHVPCQYQRNARSGCLCSIRRI